MEGAAHSYLRGVCSSCNRGDLQRNRRRRLASGHSVHGDFAGRIDIGGGRHLYLRCKGSGSPAVILESGIHDSSDVWSLTDTEPPEPPIPAVFASVARFTRVCKYDRPGTIRYTNPIALTTRSSPVYGPRTLAGMVSDLRTMLMRAGVRGPYVLVAHSYGGLILRLFAQTYADEAAGLVLVDAFGTDIKPLFGDQWPSYQAILNQPGTALDTVAGFETVDADEAIAAVEQAPALPRIPVAVISKTEPFATSPTVPEALRTQLEKVWPQVQGRLVDLGTKRRTSSPRAATTTCRCATPTSSSASSALFSSEPGWRSIANGAVFNTRTASVQPAIPRRRANTDSTTARSAIRNSHRSLPTQLA